MDSISRVDWFLAVNRRRQEALSAADSKAAASDPKELGRRTGWLNAMRERVSKRERQRKIYVGSAA